MCVFFFRIGNNVKIINSVLLDSIAVGDGCHIQNSVIGQGCNINDQASLRDCQVKGVAKCQ